MKFVQINEKEFVDIEKVESVTLHLNDKDEKYAVLRTSRRTYFTYYLKTEKVLIEFLKESGILL